MKRKPPPFRKVNVEAPIVQAKKEFSRTIEVTCFCWKCRGNKVFEICREAIYYIRPGILPERWQAKFGVKEPNLNGENEMGLPAAKDATGAGRKSTGQSQQVPFLKVEHLTTEVKRATILGIRAIPDDKYNDVKIKIAMGGNNYFWTMRLTNPNYKLMLEKFGDNEDSWAHQEILIGLDYDTFTESKYPKVSFPAEAKAAKAAK